MTNELPQVAAILLIRLFPALIQIATYGWHLDEQFYNQLRKLAANADIAPIERIGIRGLAFTNLSMGLSLSMITTSATLLVSELFQGLILLVTGFFLLFLTALNVPRLDRFQDLSTLENFLLLISIATILVTLAMYDMALSISFFFGG
jgi:hypothetical protein